MSDHTATYQGRLVLDPEQDAFLSDYAARYSMVERCLYADMRRYGKPAAAFKNDYLVRHGITARQFNAIARNLEGKITSVLRLLPQHKLELEQRITRAGKVVKKLRKGSNPLHQKKRRFNNLNERLDSLNQQITEKDPRICFGSRKLFRKQFNLKENGYVDHSEWKKDWREKRKSQFYVLGSKDETGGCQGCVISANLDGTFDLRLRTLSKELGYIVIRNVSIPYGQDVIRNALRHPQAISYRFLRDEKGWRVFVTTELPEIKTRSIKAAGAIGIDINEDCLAVTETDRSGNLVSSRVIPLVTYGKTTEQAEAIIGDAVKDVVAQAVEVQKPLVVEDLDFSKKKAELEAEEPRRARMLSSLAYNKIIQNIKSRAYRNGVEVIEINPAYTSTIGLVNYAMKYGISVHQAAAYAIARRGCGFRERLIQGKDGDNTITVPTPKGDHVTFPLPARNRGKHVWSFWSAVRKTHRAVLAAHFRPPQGDPLGLRPSKRKRPEFTVRPRNANRQQHCSADVWDADVNNVIPW